MNNVNVVSVTVTSVQDWAIFKWSLRKSYNKRTCNVC